VSLHSALARRGLTPVGPPAQWPWAQQDRPPIVPEQQLGRSHFYNLTAANYRHALRASYYMREAARELEIILRTRPDDIERED